MTDMTCRKSMQRCQTPGRCSPHGGCPDPAPVRGYLPDQKMAIVPFDLLDKSINGFEHEQGRARNELRELLAAPGNTGMGVGDGSGRLFVHGDYDSIKAMQAIILERDALRAQLAAPHLFKRCTILKDADVTYSTSSQPDPRPAGCCCPPPGHTGIWGAGMCPVHQGLRRIAQYCECPPGTDRCITQGGHFPACTACHRRLKP